jgi:lysophospholipase L1-like esterase
MQPISATLYNNRKYVTNFGPSNRLHNMPGGVSLRLMPLGGSVTKGVGSSHSAGYRKALLEILQAQNFDVRMVGSRSTGSMPNNEHEGWRGFRIDEIAKKAAKSVGRLSPNLLTVNAGSNDCIQAFKIDEAGRRMEDLLEDIWNASPGSTVLLSTLLVNADKRVNERVECVNNQFRALAKRKVCEKRRIVLVDLYNDGPRVDCLVDGVHPNDEGYDRTAKLWFDGVQRAMQQGLVVETNDSTI